MSQASSAQSGVSEYGPVAGGGEPAPPKQPRRVLIAYSMSSTYTSTTLDYLLALKQFSDFQVEYVHVTHDSRMNFDINEFDVVINNYCARLPFEGYVSKSYEESLYRFRGLKIIAVQDDYDRTANLHRAIRRLGFHVLLTCIQREFWPLAYPRSELPGLKIIQGLTGYMPERLIDCHPPITPLAERKTMLAYRGRRVGAKYGRLGFDKEEIGRRMIEICDARGIPHNIAMDDDSRIYGDAWFEFLGSSRAMLGSESACNAFDFDGELERQIAEFTVQNGRAPRYHDMIDVLEPMERYFNVGQISPRVFECALMRTPMVLFRGGYSGAIEPDQHYIPLERDFSNVDSVLANLEDLDLLQRISDNAYDRLVASGRYGYRSLAEQLTQTIKEQYPLRVDPAWVEFRAATGRPWRPLPTVELPETEEDCRQMTLVEIPTDSPLSPTDYLAREEALVNEYRKMAERLAEAEAKRLAELEAKRIRADRETFTEADRLGLTEADRLGLIEADRLGLIEAERVIGSSAEVASKRDSLAWRTLRLAWRTLPPTLRQQISLRIRNATS